METGSLSMGGTTLVETGPMQTVYMSSPSRYGVAAQTGVQMVIVSGVANWLQIAAEWSGGVVTLDSSLADLPAMRLGNGDLLPVYQFVELLDECADYASISDRVPGLGYTSIAGGVAFLRRLAQFNTRLVDIDDLEAKHDSQDPDLIAALRATIRDKETMCVLDLG